MSAVRALWQVRRFRVIFLSLLATAVVAAGTIVVVHHRHPSVQVKVLGEQFSAGNGGNGGNSAIAPAPGNGAGGNGNGNNGNGLGNGGGAKLTFTIAATVGGLVPGKAAMLPVQVTNPSSNNGTLTVTHLDVLARDAVANNAVVCAGSNLDVGTYDSSTPGAITYVIPKGGTTTVPLSILFKDLPTVNQTSCIGVTIPLTVNGSATVTR